MKNTIESQAVTDGFAQNQPDGVELARNCLRLICSIATRGVASESAMNVGYALQELSQVLFERTGSEEILFSPIAADQIGDLHRLHEELLSVDCGSQSISSDQSANTNPPVPVFRDSD
jgi:hypothetical protein